MFEFEHARPFVFGMNGTFSGVFIPQMIPLDASSSAPPLPELIGAPDAPSAPILPGLMELHAQLNADDFVLAATGPRAISNAPALPDFVHFATTLAPCSAATPGLDVSDFGFGWDAPMLPTSDLNQWDMPAVSSWFDSASFDSLSWDFFLY